MESLIKQNTLMLAPLAGYSDLPLREVAKKLGAVYIGEKVLLEHIKSTDVSEALKSEAASFDLLMYEIIKHDKNCPTNKREYPLN